MQEAITKLLDNPAFWTFLGIAVTAYFGYKQVIKKYAPKPIQKASSFEELRAVVEVLQGELIKKDKRHKDDTDYLLGQLRAVREDNRDLTIKLTQALKLAADQAEVIENLKKQLELHETRLNKDHVGQNGKT